MTADRIWYIVGKKLSGEASAEELGELEKLLHDHPDLHYSIQNITDLWRLKKKPDQTEALTALQKHLLRLGETGVQIPLHAESSYPAMTEKGSIKRTRLTVKSALFSITALLILSLAAYYFVYQSRTGATKNDLMAQQNAAAPKNEIATLPGTHSKTILPDGSTVWLNAGSKLTYNKNFNTATREVELSGEAYFDVKKDEHHPFIIHTSAMHIKVLGTAFNVKAYPGDKSSETSLIRGSIEVTMNNRPQEKIILHPSEKLVVMNRIETKKDEDETKPDPISTVTLSKINYVPADSTIMETSWLDNRLLFRNKLFAELAIELERKYGMIFRFENENAKQLMFDVNFKNETIQQVLHALQLANPFKYSIKNGEVIIK